MPLSQGWAPTVGVITREYGTGRARAMPARHYCGAFWDNLHCVDGIRRGADHEVGPSAYLRPLARFGRGGNRPRGGSVGPVMRTLTPQVAVWAPCPRCHLKGPATYRRVGATTCGAQLPGETHEAVVDSWRARSDSSQRVCDGGHQRCRCLNCCCPHLCVRAPIALLRGVRVLQHKGAWQALE